MESADHRLRIAVEFGDQDPNALKRLAAALRASLRLAARESAAIAA